MAQCWRLRIADCRDIVATDEMIDLVQLFNNLCFHSQAVCLKFVWTQRVSVGSAYSLLQKGGYMLSQRRSIGQVIWHSGSFDTG